MLKQRECLSSRVQRDWKWCPDQEEEEKRPNRNGYKVRAFSNAIKVITHHDRPILSAEEALMLKGVGHGITKRISDFLDQAQDGAPALEPYALTEAQKRRAALVLQRLPGIGRVKAQELANAGCMTPEDIRNPKYSKILSDAQKTKLKYFQHSEQSATLEDAQIVSEFIRQNVSSRFEVIVTGDHRRAAPTAPCISLLLLHPDHVFIPFPSVPPPHVRASKPGSILHKPFRPSYISVTARAASPLHGDIVPMLTDRGLLAACLSSGIRRWSGIVRIPQRDPQGGWHPRNERLEAIRRVEGVYKRLDLILSPMKSRGAALLALTGDAEFTRDIRTRALRRGMHLDEYGLWRWNPEVLTTEAEAPVQGVEPGAHERGFWELVRANTEEEILGVLGTEYVGPERRNFAYLKKPLERIPAAEKSVDSGAKG
ncbi:hypothetical protein BD779DRAFT_1668869 [Infundibulicybe gibba]|nr:hypothetical protein BD779DRAFT_1668869 [Infundibulicybe gibba]